MKENSKSEDRDIIYRRKEEHLNICLEENVRASRNFLDLIEIVHRPVPEMDFDEIDISTEFLGKKLSSPLMISAITGGCESGEKVNGNLAGAASELDIGMGVGSQRGALEDKDLESSFSCITDHAPKLLLANIGLPQLILAQRKEGKEGIISLCSRCMDMIKADALCIHLNYLQEVVQPEGDLIARGGLEVIKTASGSFPVIVKETGAGMDKKTVMKLKKAGAAGVDIGGRGGTTFSGVEHFRQKKVIETCKGEQKSCLGMLLWDWGIPTPVSVKKAKGILPMIATGGVRNGMDAFKLLALGADMVGIAGIILPSALEEQKDVEGFVEKMNHELRSVMFLTNSKNIPRIRKAKLIFHNELKNWFA